MGKASTSPLVLSQAEVRTHTPKSYDSLRHRGIHHDKTFPEPSVWVFYIFISYWQAFPLLLHLVTSGASKAGESALTAW